MNLQQRIGALGHWGGIISEKIPEMEPVIVRTYHNNKWFTPANIEQSLKAIVQNFLQEKALQQWLSAYELHDTPPKTIGIVMAGNIPLVGFHDLLCVLGSGHKAQVKLSSKDPYLLPYLTGLLTEAYPWFKDQVAFSERLSGFDAIIATGGNNTSRYFEEYFGKYPHIIRRNRNSIAILSGKEKPDELMLLGIDIFRYFGLGCRNVSKLYLPKGYEIPKLLDQLEVYRDIIEHDKYRNNYDYNRTLLLLNNVPHLASDFLMVREAATTRSPIACLHYEFYDDLVQLTASLAAQADEIQCLVSHLPIEGAIPFGQSQQPQLWDYADKVDTMQFLGSIN
ncbi:MAG: acyl-CoA reductase [Chitinophagales bacterium]|nr:acyl-CoA reductase [Chitinophagales bacterium]